MAKRKGEAPLDFWSLPHTLSGLAVGFVGLHWILSIAAILAFEVVEGLLRRVKRSGGRGLFEYESWPNIIADVALGIGGFVAWSLLLPKVTLLRWLGWTP